MSRCQGVRKRGGQDTASPWGVSRRSEKTQQVILRIKVESLPAREAPGPMWVSVVTELPGNPANENTADGIAVVLKSLRLSGNFPGPSQEHVVHAEVQPVKQHGAARG